MPYFPWIDEDGLLGWDVHVPFWGHSLFPRFKRTELFKYRGEAPSYRFPSTSRPNQTNTIFSEEGPSINPCRASPIAADFVGIVVAPFY
jgi:hypothetical protein